MTICTKDRECLFCDIVNREMLLNNAGRMVDKWCGELENKFPDIKCNKYIIMPNHFHAIIQNTVGADLRVCPDGNRAGPTMGKRVAGENVTNKFPGSASFPRCRSKTKRRDVSRLSRGIEHEKT